MIDIDIICPVYKSYEKIKTLIESFSCQKGVSIKKIVCSLTLSENNLENERIEDFFKKNSISYFKLNKCDFSHSLTREKMIVDYCSEDIVVILSQDVILKDENSLFYLVNPIFENKTAYNYGKQIVENNCIEKYVRSKNYPQESRIIEKSENMGIMDFFSSDSFSALNRNVFIKINGYQKRHLTMNEDQLLSYYLFENGYKKGYIAEAVVIHYHKWKLKDIYERYYQSGKFYNENVEFQNIETNSAGFKLSLYVLKEILIHFDIVSLFLFIPNMLARYIGFRKGKRSKQ